MSRVLTIARSEFLTLVRTKAFIIGVLMMPVLFGVFTLFMTYADKHVDLADRRVAVVDQTGVLFAPLAAAAAEHNTASGEGDARTGPHFLLDRVDPAGRSLDAVKLDLSEQVKTKAIFAFVIIPSTVFDALPQDPGSTAPAPAHDPSAVAYYTETTSYDALPDWLRPTMNDLVARERFARAGIDQTLVKRLTSRTALARFGLVQREANGSVSDAPKVDALALIGPPTFFLVLMFVAVMTSAQHLLNAIIEEKMSRISEVLLGSVSHLQLLLGKLAGVTAVSVLLVLIYFAGALYAVVQSGRWDLLNPALMAWFVVFLICAALMYGAVFLALGSACTTINDAQSLLQPAMMVLFLAYFGSAVVLRAPDSPLAVGMSFFPAMTPFAMMLRIAMPPGAPLWQVLLALVELVGVTGLVVWGASRVFRIGILMQGKAPTLVELLKWIRV